MGRVINATPRPLYLRERDPYPLYRRLGGPQDRYGRVQKISPPTGIRSSDRPSRSKSLYRLSYPGQSPHTRTEQKVKRTLQSFNTLHPQPLATQFDVFLTVHHSIDFSKYQLSAQFF